MLNQNDQTRHTFGVIHKRQKMHCTLVHHITHIHNAVLEVFITNNEININNFTVKLSFITVTTTCSQTKTNAYPHCSVFLYLNNPYPIKQKAQPQDSSFDKKKNSRLEWGDIFNHIFYYDFKTR